MELIQVQRDKIAQAMRKYELYINQGIPTFGDGDYRVCGEVKAELGLPSDFSAECSSCNARPRADFYFKELYRLWQ